jgi:hypothetical protein
VTGLGGVMGCDEYFSKDGLTYTHMENGLKKPITTRHA